MADARPAVEMLVTEDPDRARSLAADLEVQNAERRAIEETMVAEAIRSVEARPDHRQARTIMVANDGWHAGVVGIVAARLAERFHRPALVVALEDGIGRGSGRSVRGVHLHAVLSECADLLEAFGGHRQAVGLTVRRGNLRTLAARFEEEVRRRTAAAEIEPVLEIDAEASVAAMTPAVVSGLTALEPHGPGNPEPALVARAVEVEGVRLVGDPSRPHLKLRLRQDGRTVPGIAFGMGHLPVRPGDRLDVVYTPRLRQWQGLERLELEVLDVRASPADGSLQVCRITKESGIP